MVHALFSLLFVLEDKNQVFFSLKQSVHFLRECQRKWAQFYHFHHQHKIRELIWLTNSLTHSVSLIVVLCLNLKANLQSSFVLCTREKDVIIFEFSCSNHHHHENLGSNNLEMELKMAGLLLLQVYTLFGVVVYKLTLTLV